MSIKVWKKQCVMVTLYFIMGNILKVWKQMSYFRAKETCHNIAVFNILKKSLQVLPKTSPQS